ncbi:yippee-like protein [Tilletiopsis washingtonensis]|uniref:Protein yippee-like n=1 Tax=Tilletiopsis washingtonensis TaxID=58919 RepID=A0A316Z9P7_9BASI|nr:yippee-like protein [Tilletiopsis washingtonensis]PWN98430.1 yippee-like protein [Tilletiopsis washingtonensis]
MGLKHPQFLAATQVWGCHKCRTHLAVGESLVSTKFNGQTGRAYLFDQVVNITCGDPEDRHMTTGMHTVRDICCERCGCTLGWKYDKAFVTSEKYKEGKFILEKNLITHAS